MARHPDSYSYSRQTAAESSHTHPQHDHNEWKLVVSSTHPAGGALASPDSPIPSETNYSWLQPTLFDILDAILLLSCFRSVPVADGHRPQYSVANRSQKVAIKVEATIVNEDQDAANKSKNMRWKKQFDLDSKLAKSNGVERYWMPCWRQ